MASLTARLLGVILSIAGTVLLAYLARVSYGDVARWGRELIHIGMPMMLLLALAGFCILGGGLSLLVRPPRRR